VPWKRLAFELSDEADASARDTGVANVLSLDGDGRVRASNTDAGALAEEIALDCPRPRAAVVIGAGGAAQAAVVACRSLGVDAPVVTSRGFAGAPESWPRADAFVALGAVPMAWPGVEGSAPFAASDALLDALLGADVLVQATSAGMRGAGPGAAVSDWVPWARLQPGALAIDVVYNPPQTPFLAAASAAGLLARGGLGMLVRQAALAIRLWFGDMPDLAPLRRAAQEALGAAGPS
jgi:shikimate dehydrogenase